MQRRHFHIRAHTAVLMGISLAGAVLLLLVGGIVGYSTYVIDRQGTASEVELTERRFDLSLARLRENLLSATVWSDAYSRTLAADHDWMQLNYGQYFANTMGHDVTIAYSADGKVI